LSWRDDDLGRRLVGGQGERGGQEVLDAAGLGEQRVEGLGADGEA
jgi:hypothetical protein